MASAFKFFFRTGILLLALHSTVKSDDTCDIEIENTLKQLLTPQEYPSIQLQSLRQDFLRRFKEVLNKVEEDEEAKRSLSSLARWNNLPDKRNVESLARNGYIRTLPDEEENSKRSQSTYSEAYGDDKRGIEALARNGDLQRQREIEQLIDELYEKRNIESLARNLVLPHNQKRNLASLARSGHVQGKRNVAAFLRQTDYSNERKDEGQGDKRNIGSIKAQSKFKRSTRRKRQTDFEEESPSPVYQTQEYDYEDLMRALTGDDFNPQKRFLGSVARSGWFTPSTARFNSPEKRHIGALARLGWLPTYRNVRRFNRSGRSAFSESCREASADGQAEDNTTAEESPSLEDKRFFLQPAVDKILLRRIFMHPRLHPKLSKFS